MDLKYRAQDSCPPDELLGEFKGGSLLGELRDFVLLHLQFCDACLCVLEQIDLTIDRLKEFEVKEIREKTRISDRLAAAIKDFAARDERRRARAIKSLEEVEKEGGLRVGQIWRTLNDKIHVPAAKRKLEIAELNSTPHLVVITEVRDSEGPFLGYHIIKVAPISVDKEFKGKDDYIITDSFLEYPIMIELWNEQLMLKENLDCLLGSLEAEQLSSFVLELALPRESSPVSVEDAVRSGEYRDPIVRFRAHEFEETFYLRGPTRTTLEITSTITPWVWSNWTNRLQ